jgi:hypothetical protein
MMLRVHKLKHPIGYFVAAVLVVIAAGVGIVAGTTNQKVYGPPWGRFSASFSGLVSEQRYLPLLGVLPSGTAVILPTVVRFLAFGNFTGWTGYQPLTIVDLDSVWIERVPQARLTATVRQLVIVVKHGFRPMEVTPVERNANGFSVVTFGPRCMGSICQGALMVWKGRTLWILHASSPGRESQVQGFLDSFEPIG